ncbi:type IV pilus modification PilV family protein [Alteromonas sp. H39]|uniref:type IV pilus modification PilV family protein n=1 Tax=Alteromonas sp. H39 TaxID=3389876 RepID=UPI0039DFE4A9
MISKALVAGRYNRGFSLIECLIATLLFTLSCLGIFSLYQRQILATQSLVLWYDARNLATAKASDLYAQALQSHAAVAAIDTDTGGELSAGNLTINKDGRSIAMARHWQVTTLKTHPAALKLATITVSILPDEALGNVEHGVVLWHSGPAELPQVEDFNPDSK